MLRSSQGHYQSGFRQPWGPPCSHPHFTDEDSEVRWGCAEPWWRACLPRAPTGTTSMHGTHAYTLSLGSVPREEGPASTPSLPT